MTLKKYHIASALSLLVIVPAVSETSGRSVDKIHFLQMEMVIVTADADSVPRLRNQLQSKMHNNAEVLTEGEIKLDSIQLKLSSKIGSLRSLKLPDTIISSQLSGLQRKLDSLKGPGSAKDLKQVQERLSSGQDNANKKVEDVQEKVNQKMELFSSNGGNIPDVNLPNANVPGAVINLPHDVNPGLSIPNANLPSVDNPIGNIHAPDLKVDPNLVETPQLPDVKIDNIKKMKEVGELREKLGAVDQVGDEIKGHQEDLKNLQSGDLSKMEQLPEAIESNVENMDQLEGLKEQVGDFEAIKKKWNDPEVMKEEALNRAKETAVNHFAGHEEELKAVMERMSKLKSKIPDPEGPVDLFKKRQQFLKAKPVVERFVPGLTFQLQKQLSFWLDLNPQIGFKISARWLAGAGWNERWAYNFKADDWDPENRIYGVRTFVHFKLRDNIWLKADVEDMNAPYKKEGFKSGGEIVGRKWIVSYMAGLKKDFQFSKSFRGNVQMLYNFYNRDRNSPYTSPFNVRMGFEWPLRKMEKN